MKLGYLLIGVLAGWALPLTVMAQTAAPPLSAILAKLESQGYVVSEIDVDPSVIEVEAVAADGRRMELLLDPATGAVTHQTPDT